MSVELARFTDVLATSKLGWYLADCRNWDEKPEDNPPFEGAWERLTSLRSFFCEKGPYRALYFPRRLVGAEMSARRSHGD